VGDKSVHRGWCYDHKSGIIHRSGFLSVAPAASMEYTERYGHIRSRGRERAMAGLVGGDVNAWLVFALLMLTAGLGGALWAAVRAGLPR